MSIFSQVSLRRPKKSKFDLSHERKMSLNMGSLVPILVQDILPGDSFRVQTEMLARLTPMLAPMMHRVKIYTHFFFVPNRLVWNEWEDFITGGKDGTSVPVAPYFNINTTNAADGKFLKRTLSDYMGLPEVTAAAVTDVTKVSALPYRAYQLIYNEYFRDQNLTNEIDFAVTSGEVTQASGDLVKITTMRKRAWEKDYFTSALPWAQRGASASLPINVVVDTARRKDGNNFITNGPNTSIVIDKTAGVATEPLKVTDNAVLTDVELFGTNTTITINDLRRVTRLQEWLEKNARGGARYVEQILSHFGVKSSDARLQRPEYLGGANNPIVISEVLNTTDAGTDPLGEMGGHGVGVSNIHGFSRRFEEHGYVIGIMSILPKTAYQQGIPRHLTKFDKLDYAWPEFAQLGEQEIKLKELYYAQAAALNTGEGTFGYTPRYAEYKYKDSSVHGDFKGNLSYWHMGRIFASAPALNTSFVESDPTFRIFAVTDPNVDHVLVQLYNKISAIRPLPYFGTPNL